MLRRIEHQKALQPRGLVSSLNTLELTYLSNSYIVFQSDHFFFSVFFCFLVKNDNIYRNQKRETNTFDVESFYSLIFIILALENIAKRLTTGPRLTLIFKQKKLRRDWIFVH